MGEGRPGRRLEKGCRAVRGAELSRVVPSRPGEEGRGTDILGAESMSTVQLGRAWPQKPRQKGPLLF